MIPLSAPPPARSGSRGSARTREGADLLRTDPSMPFLGYFVEMAEELIKQASEGAMEWPPRTPRR